MLSPAFSIALITLCASVAAADTLLTAELNNANEVSGTPVIPTLTTGDPRPASFGSATFVLNDAQTALTYSITVNNIDLTGTQTVDTNDNLGAAHIHAPATPAQNTGVVFGFFGTPFNDNNPLDVVVTPFAVGVGGTITGKWDAPEGQNTTLAAQIDNLLNGHAYVNVHTTQFPGGEIRGTILVPEPSIAALLGFAGMVGFALRRHKRA